MDKIKRAKMVMAGSPLMDITYQDYNQHPSTDTLKRKNPGEVVRFRAWKDPESSYFFTYEDTKSHCLKEYQTRSDLYFLADALDKMEQPKLAEKINKALEE